MNLTQRNSNKYPLWFCVGNYVLNVQGKARTWMKHINTRITEKKKDMNSPTNNKLIWTRICGFLAKTFYKYLFFVGTDARLKLVGNSSHELTALGIFIDGLVHNCLPSKLHRIRSSQAQNPVVSVWCTFFGNNIKNRLSKKKQKTYCTNNFMLIDRFQWD